MPKLLVEGKAPQYGLPFQRLPQGDMTPESYMNEQIQTGRQQIQDKYALQWKEVNRSRRFIGAGKSKNMLRQIDTRAKQEMLQFNQQAQQQMVQIQNIDRLAQQGMISNADEIKARLVFGPDVAKSMYPTPEKGQSVPQAMGRLDRYKEIVQSNIDRYRSVRIPEWWTSKSKEKTKTQFLDYSLPSKKEGEIGDWRDTTEEDIRIKNYWEQELKEIKKREVDLIAIPGISHRVVQPGTTGGTFSDKVTESYRPPVTRRQPERQRQQPTATELRQQGTREAYEVGKRLGYWE